jgi:twitching motility two-component system response regulator PilH
MAETNERPPVLVVDDSMFQRRLIRQALQGNGYKLVEAIDGATAVKAIEQQEFACILTDLVMPGLDGFGLLAEIQRRQIRTPVVVLTADIQKSTRERCEQLGAVAFVQKPVDGNALRSALSGAMGGRS